MKQVRIILRTGHELQGLVDSLDSFDFNRVACRSGSDQLQNFSKGDIPILLRLSEVSAIYVTEVPDA